MNINKLLGLSYYILSFTTICNQCDTLLCIPAMFFLTIIQQSRYFTTLSKWLNGKKMIQVTTSTYFETVIHGNTQNKQATRQIIY